MIVTNRDIDIEQNQKLSLVKSSKYLFSGNFGLY